MTQFFCNKIIDISLPLNQNTITYPGNPKIEFVPQKSATSGSQITTITFGSHTGTHIDAPSHVIESGKNIEQMPLNVFIGLCRILDLTSCETSIEVEDLEQHRIRRGDRILVKTKNSDIGFEEFYNDYVFLSPEAAKYLAQKEIMLFGIDYLSVKQRGSKDNTAHTALLSQNIPIIEGLNLQNVEAGNYFLVALPLEFTGIDGSPARVVLFR